MNKQEQAKENLDLRAALELPAVRDVLWRMISMCNVYAKSNSGVDVKVGNYRNGRRDIGLELIDMIEDASSDAWMIMQQENREG